MQFPESVANAHDHRYPNEVKSKDFIQSKREAIKEGLLLRLEDSDGGVMELLRLIGEYGDGLEKYSLVLSKRAIVRIEEIVLDQVPNELKYPIRLARIFECISKMILNDVFHEPILTERVIETVEAKVAKFMGDFVKDRNLKQGKHSLREQDLLLTECTLMEQHVFAFRQFCESYNCGFMKGNQMLANEYVDSELEYIRQGINKVSRKLLLVVRLMESVGDADGSICGK